MTYRKMINIFIVMLFAFTSYNTSSLADNFKKCQEEHSIKSCTLVINGKYDPEDKITKTKVLKAYYHRGRIYFAKKLYKKAIYDFTQASKHPPSDYENIRKRSVLNIGSSHLALGQISLAEKYYQIADKIQDHWKPTEFMIDPFEFSYSGFYDCEKNMEIITRGDRPTRF